MKNYLKRVVDDSLDFEISSTGALLLTGLKWCGKSTTAKFHSKSVVLMEDSIKRMQYRELARTRPDILLAGDVPRLIDEWQVVPSLWDAVRSECDSRGELGQFILTGSSVPPNTNEIMHSGTGRIARFSLRTMSLWESLDSTGMISLKDLFSGNLNIGATSKMSLEEYAFALCRGGWPLAVTSKSGVALKQSENYVKSLIEEDMRRIDGVRRDPDKTLAILRSYGRLTAKQASIKTMLADIATRTERTFGETALTEYLNALKKLFVIEDLDAWNPMLLRKNTIRQAPTRHLSDPSIATAALGISPSDLMDDLPSFGFLFESMAVRDLRVYADAINGKVSHFLDRYGNEVDAVIHLKDGSYALIEIKLGSSEGIEEGARSLKKVASLIDLTRMKKPSFVAVVTATDMAYSREDGVYVIPLACLKP